jgi:DNA-binding MarR family transcriptional regulator
MVNDDRLDYLSKKWNRQRPSLDISPWQVWGRITRLHELFVARIAPELTAHELNFKEFQTLAALVLSGEPYEATPAAIARFNLLTSGGVANLLARMEREGLVERRPDQIDKRSVIVKITDHGLAAFDAAVVNENRVEHDLLYALSPEERSILATLLRKLLVSMDPVEINGE